MRTITRDDKRRAANERKRRNFERSQKTHTYFQPVAS